MSEMRGILAFETCTTGCSVAVGDGKTMLASLTDERLNYQARELLPMIEAALKQAGMTYADLQALVTTTGPGSFTGIRVGLAAARAIVLAHKMRTIGLNTLEAIAWRAIQQSDLSSQKRIASVWNASKGQAYVQSFEWSDQHLITLANPQLIDVEKLPAFLKKFDLVAGNVIADSITAPHAEALLLRCKFQGLNELPLVPLYIRDADAKLPGTKTA